MFTTPGRLEQDNAPYAYGAESLRSMITNREWPSRKKSRDPAFFCRTAGFFYARPRLADDDAA
jgi:hypothetical protein